MDKPQKHNAKKHICFYLYEMSGKGTFIKIPLFRKQNIFVQKTKVMPSGPITLWQIDAETMETVTDYFFGLQNHCRWWLQPWNQKMLAPWKKSYDKPRQHIKKQRHYFANKGSSGSSQGYGFSSSHVWMWDLDYKERWEPKNWCFWTVVLEKTL